MNRAAISPDLCKGCGVCVNACPRRCLTLGKGINEIGYHPAEFMDGTKCLACGLCFYVCPEPGAITVHKSDQGKGQDQRRGDVHE